MVLFEVEKWLFLPFQSRVADERYGVKVWLKNFFLASVG